jgi:hypothetical protein
MLGDGVANVFKAFLASRINIGRSGVRCVSLRASDLEVDTIPREKRSVVKME